MGVGEGVAAVRVTLSVGSKRGCSYSGQSVSTGHHHLLRLVRRRRRSQWNSVQMRNDALLEHRTIPGHIETANDIYLTHCLITRSVIIVIVLLVVVDEVISVNVRGEYVFSIRGRVWERDSALGTKYTLLRLDRRLTLLQDE
jgi:hypothetical protein